MARDYVYPDMKELSFEFFYCFSMIEFALKQNKFHLRIGKSNAVQPDWNRFITIHEHSFPVIPASQELLQLSPKVQVLTDERQLAWEALAFKPEDSPLRQVVISLKTVRNNLFHGGKARDLPARTRALLDCGIKVIDHLANVGQFEEDYRGRY